MRPKLLACSSSEEVVRAVEPQPDHPSYFNMVLSAILAIKKRGGLSRSAIRQYILNNFDVMDDKQLDRMLRQTLDRAVRDDRLRQCKQSFSLPKKSLSLPKKSVSITTKRGRPSKSQPRPRTNRKR